MGAQGALRLSAAEQEELRKKLARDSRMERILSVREQERKAAEERRRRYQAGLQKGLAELQVRKQETPPRAAVGSLSMGKEAMHLAGGPPQAQMQAEWDRERGEELATLQTAYEAALERLGAAQRDADEAARGAVLASIERQALADYNGRVAQDRGRRALAEEAALRAARLRPLEELLSRKGHVREVELQRALARIAKYQAGSQGDVAVARPVPCHLAPPLLPLLS